MELKRLPLTYEDHRDYIVRYEYRQGDQYRIIEVDRHIAERSSLKEIAAMFGLRYELPTGRKDVKKRGRKIGTVPATFDPMFIKSTNWLYEPRPYDWTDKGDHWEAHHSLGPGDLEAVPGFVWDRTEDTPTTTERKE